MVLEIEFDPGKIDIAGWDIESAEEGDEVGVEAFDGDDAVDMEAFQMPADASQTRDFGAIAIKENLVMVLKAIVLHRVDQGDVVAEVR